MLRAPSQALYPVLGDEPRYALELAEVVGNEDEPFAAGVRGDVQVVDADGPAYLLERGADGAVVLRGLGAVGQHFEQASELLYRGQVLGHFGALLRTVQKFAQCDG